MRTRDLGVFYEERGCGLPVVVLRAAFDEPGDFDLVAERLAPRFRTFTVVSVGADSRSGAGTGARRAGRFSTETLQELAWDLSLPPAVYVCRGATGYAAAGLAIAQPERVAALVLVIPDHSLRERLGEVRAPTMLLSAPDTEELPALLERFIEEAVITSVARTG